MTDFYMNISEITETAAQNWLSISAAIFLLCMVLHGHYKGFLQIAVTMSALVISMFFVRIAAPHVTGFLKENTQIQQMIQKTLVNTISSEELMEEVGANLQIPEYQKKVIEELPFPGQMKEVLLENNRSEIYEILGVATFLEYVGAYLADMVLNLIGSIILFVLVYVSLRIIVYGLDLIAHLPILHGINQIAGAILGLVRGLLWIWGFFLVTELLSGMAWTQPVISQIHKSLWLTFLYQNNLFNWIFGMILRCFI